MRPDEPCPHERDATGPLARFCFRSGLPCGECAREAHDAWLDTVRAKLIAGIEAAARGERYDWNSVDPPPDTDYPEPESAEVAFVIEPRPQPEPWTLERICAFYDERERSKRVLACASDVYERVRDAVQGGPLVAVFRVIEQPLLDDGQVLSIDPAALEPPPFEFEFTLPDYRCASCMRKVPLPGLCGICASMAGLLFGPRPGSTSIIAGLGGLT